MAETILVVDDDASVCKMLVKALDRAGYQAHGALTAESSLTLLRKHSFDLAVLDVVLPGVRGTELAWLLCQQYPDLLILVISGHPEEIEKFKALPLRRVGFLKKAFEPSSFVSAVRALLSRAKPGPRKATLHSVEHVLELGGVTAHFGDSEWAILQKVLLSPSPVPLDRLGAIQLQSIRTEISRLNGKMRCLGNLRLVRNERGYVVTSDGLDLDDLRAQLLKAQS